MLPPPLGVRPASADEQFVAGVDITVAKALVVLPRLYIPCSRLCDLPESVGNVLLRHNLSERERVVQFHDLLECVVWTAKGTPMAAPEDAEQELVLHGESMRVLRFAVTTLAWPEGHRVVQAWRQAAKKDRVSVEIDTRAARGELDLPSSVSPIEQLEMLEADAEMAMEQCGDDFAEMDTAVK